MTSEISFQQFAFFPDEKEVLLQLSEQIRQGLLRQIEQAAERDFANPVEGLQELKSQLDKFLYYLGEESEQKLTLSAPLLIEFIWALQRSMNHEGLDNEEGLALYYKLSRKLTYTFTSQVYFDFMRQYRTPEYLAWENSGQHHHINTAGMDEVAVFTALYNAAKPQGLSILHDSVENISLEEGAALMARDSDTDFDYVNGRRMKISRDQLEKGYVDVTQYDEGNGAGAALNAVKHIPRR